MKNNLLHPLQDKQKRNSLTMGSPTKTKSLSKIKWLNRWLNHYSSELNRNKKKPKNNLNYKDLKKKRNVKKKQMQKQRKNV